LIAYFLSNICAKIIKLISSKSELWRNEVVTFLFGHSVVCL